MRCVCARVHVCMQEIRIAFLSGSRSVGLPAAGRARKGRDERGVLRVWRRRNDGLWPVVQRETVEYLAACVSSPALSQPPGSRHRHLDVSIVVLFYPIVRPTIWKAHRFLYPRITLYGTLIACITYDNTVWKAYRLNYPMITLYGKLIACFSLW